MKKWTEEELLQLERLYNEGKTYSEIAIHLGRSLDSVEKAIRRYGHILQLNRENHSLFFNENKECILIKKACRKHLYEFIYNTIVDAINHHYKKLKIPEIKIPKSSPKKKSIEIANLVISDLHIGKVNKIYDVKKGKTVITYDDNIRKKMIKVFLSSIFEIISLHRPKYFYEKLNIFLLGDIIEGDGYVWEGQQFNVSKCVGLQLWDAVYEIAGIIKELQKLFPKIDVYCIVGNHSLATPNREADLPIENYLEYHLYRILQLLFRENKKVNIIVPNTYDYSIKIYDHLVYMAHGNKLTRGSSITTRIKKAKDIYINLPEGYELFIIGHFHSAEKYAIGDKGTLLINGGWIPCDSYAKKLYGVYSEPKQLFFSSNERRTITWLYELDFKEVIEQIN